MAHELGRQQVQNALLLSVTDTSFLNDSKRCSAMAEHQHDQSDEYDVINMYANSIPVSGDYSNDLLPFADSTCEDNTWSLLAGQGYHIHDSFESIATCRGRSVVWGHTSKGFTHYSSNLLTDFEYRPISFQHNVVSKYCCCAMWQNRPKAVLCHGSLA